MLQLRNIRRLVPTAVFQSLIVALVLSRLDYNLLHQCVGWVACQLDSACSVVTERGSTAHFQDTALQLRAHL